MKNKKKANELFAKLALKATATTANSACFIWTYQPKLPEKAKKLRKF